MQSMYSMHVLCFSAKLIICIYLMKYEWPLLAWWFRHSPVNVEAHSFRSAEEKLHIENNTAY